VLVKAHLSFQRREGVSGGDCDGEEGEQQLEQ
jgi:hypothetical protein